MNCRFKSLLSTPCPYNEQVVPIRSSNPQDAALLRSISSPGALIVPSASQAWQIGHRSRSEDPSRIPSLVSAGSMNDRMSLVGSSSTPCRPLASTPHSRQPSSTLSTTNSSSTSLAGLLTPGTTVTLPMHQLHEEEGYYTSIHTSKVAVFSRRTTSDARTKVKLSLLGVRVERCGVCLLQFREGDMGAKTNCEHV
jgi:hypothetical protein